MQSWPQGAPLKAFGTNCQSGAGARKEKSGYIGCEVSVWVELQQTMT